MAVFITCSTDAFEEIRAEALVRQPPINVRRPLRGITLKEDTYSVLRVVGASGEEIPIFDSSSPEVDDNGIGRSSQFANFITQSVQEQRMEKQQIIETFGDSYIFFFGERPRFITVSGLLVNSKDFNWKSEFMANYEQYLRGTRLVELNAKLYFYFDDIVVEGYLTQCSVNMMADQPYLVQLQFQMYVCQYAIISDVGSVVFQDATATPTAQGLPPETTAGRATQARAQAGNATTLNSFLVQARSFMNNADTSIQQALEQLRNDIVVPKDLSGAVRPTPITNQASFEPAPRGRPINNMDDEYVVNLFNRELALDRAESNRVAEELRLQTPEELEKVATAQLEKLGVDASRRETSYLLLGRGAFAATQYVASFGARQAQGSLNLSLASPSNVNI